MKIDDYLKRCDQVYHTTLDPKKSGVVRIHLVPPKKPKVSVPWVAILNGYSVIPLQSSWAVLLKEFIEAMNATGGGPMTDEEIDGLLDGTVHKVSLLYPKAETKTIKNDLIDLVLTLKQIAQGKEPDVAIGYMTLSEYGKYMKAPHRMDLLLSPMTKNGQWNCNQHCLHCYAAEEPQASVAELSTEQWKKIIDACREACIPALTFTGGEPTLRQDLPELVGHAKWFVTRLNTNGIRLTESLCRELAEASLDSVQVTLYSFDETIHDTLVGGKHFRETVQRIKNALKAGLDVSVNTPLCSLNRDYLETLRFAHELGVTYFSCSGLIPTGNAKTPESRITALGKDEITAIVVDACKKAREMGAEISFTSPGWIDEAILKKNHLVVPSCGACLSNMAVAPNGDVIPCQSWLEGTVLGNLLTDKWPKIWSSQPCRRIRKKAMETTQVCLLKGEQR